MESFFAYSQATALNHHQFPCQLTDIHDRMFSIQAITQQYRVFVITLDSIDHHKFILNYLDTLVASSSFKSFVNDVRFIILCPGSKHQFSSNLKKYRHNHVYWIVSTSLAKQLQVYCTYDNYYGPFLLEVHENGYWQLVRHIDPEQDGPMEWLTWSLLATRQECEQRAQSSVKTSQRLVNKLQQQLTNITTTSTTTTTTIDDEHHRRRRYSTTTATWGWPVCPLEIKYAILNQIDSIDDLMRCTHVDDDDDTSMYEIILTWLIQRLEMHLRPLIKTKHILPLKTLASHERQLSWLVFQLQPYTSSSPSY